MSDELERIMRADLARLEADDTPIGQTVIMLRVMAEGLNGTDYQTCLDAAGHIERLERELAACRGLLGLVMDQPTNMQVALDNARKNAWVRAEELTALTAKHAELDRIAGGFAVNVEHMLERHGEGEAGLLFDLGQWAVNLKAWRGEYRGLPK